MRQQKMWGLVSALVLGTVTMTVQVIAAEPELKEEIGKAEYLRYCSSCHGAGGKGDGFVATFLRPKPPDLTQLAKKNGGEFPYVRVMHIIDGRKGPGAHGESDMPVWGEIFHQQTGSTTSKQLEVQGKIMVITEYLHSIQQK